MIEGNMASVSGTNAADNTAKVPQWKRDLIQRRRQQNKGLVNNVTGVYTAVSVVTETSLINDTTESLNNINDKQTIDTSNLIQELSRDDAVQVTPPVQNIITSGAVITTATTTMTRELNDCDPAVACNMHLEVNGSLCPTSEDTPKMFKNHSLERKMEFDKCNIGSRNYIDKKYNNEDITDDIERKINNKTGICDYRISRIDKFNKNINFDNNSGTIDDCESDSSEELQYGPGIVNKLKSKYLNLTLREMNKTRTTVQRFRRAASLEDLLDCDDDAEKTTRKFIKKQTTPGSNIKNERYRNTSRGNDSIKRARSVEALVRYQTSDDEKHLTNKFIGSRQEPVNDHIVLIDRTTVNIENRLMKSDHPKAINKPKRIKPLLADTERPPPDLVKTTMRIFEGSVKKHKPKGEVAVKVATFKTINDTFKAQTVRKVLPKPPLQPKPFVNGNFKALGLTKKAPIPLKLTADVEITESPDKHRNNGVATDPIVQSVSSVVSKFQQIEKSCSSPSSSSSPEPIHNKFKFSPAPSPEPLSVKVKSSTEGCAKAVPIVLCPLASKRDSSRSNTNLPCQVTLSENTCQILASDKSESLLLIQVEKERDPLIVEITENHSQVEDKIFSLEETKSVEEKDKIVTPVEIDVSKEESTDESKILSKSLELNFDNECTLSKSSPEIDNSSKPSNGVTDIQSVDSQSPVPSNISIDSDSTDSNMEKNSRIQEMPDFETSNREIKIELPQVNDKPIGAISNLGLIKTSTIPSYPSTKESKLNKSQKNTSPIQKQIGIIRPLVSMKTQLPQQNLSNRELEKNLINRVKNIEQPTKVVVSLKCADDIQPVKKTSTSGTSSGDGGGSGGLWDTKPWNQQNNTMVFNFSNRKDVPDYIENDGLIIRRKREKPKVGDGGIIVLDATLDASTTDESDWEVSRGPPSPCDVLFTNDNILINGRSNLIRTPRNHKNRIQFDDDATRTFEYPSEASMLEDDAGGCLGGETSATGCNDDYPGVNNKSTCSMSTTGNAASPILGGGGLASYTPSKVDLKSDGFELGVTRSVVNPSCVPGQQWECEETDGKIQDQEHLTDPHDAAAWGAEATADLLY